MLIHELKGLKFSMLSPTAYSCPADLIFAYMLWMVKSFWHHLKFQCPVPFLLGKCWKTTFEMHTDTHQTAFRIVWLDTRWNVEKQTKELWKNCRSHVSWTCLQKKKQTQGYVTWMTDEAFIILQSSCHQLVILFAVAPKDLQWHCWSAQWHHWPAHWHKLWSEMVTKVSCKMAPLTCMVAPLICTNNL